MGQELSNLFSPKLKVKFAIVGLDNSGKTTIIRQMSKNYVII